MSRHAAPGVIRSARITHIEVAAVNRGERVPAIRSSAGLKAPASGLAAHLL
jgi:hypothetical protein